MQLYCHCNLHSRQPSFAHDMTPRTYADTVASIKNEEHGRPHGAYRLHSLQPMSMLQTEQNNA